MSVALCGLRQRMTRFSKVFSAICSSERGTCIPVTNEGDQECGLGKTCLLSEQGLVLGLYSLNDGVHETSYFTKTAAKVNAMWCNKIFDLLRVAGPAPKLGEYRVFIGITIMFPITCVVGLGHECAGYDEMEMMDCGKENIRVAAAVAARATQRYCLNKLLLESFNHAESCAEGAALAIWMYQEFKTPAKRKHITNLDLYDSCDWTGWQIGLQKAAAQNLAKQLMEAPANHMTPIIFAQTSVEVLCKTGINVEVRVQNWAESKGMGAFIAVGKGSANTPLFLEVSYYGSDNFKERPIVLVGQGCTFDSGGICIKMPGIIEQMRGDIAGAAIIVGACRAIAALQLPINVRGLIPLCDNMPGCSAMKPGDVAITMNGKSIYIEQTNCEGRLMLSDALCYAQQYWPKFIVSIASAAEGRGLSTAASSVFSNSDALWEQLRMAAVHTGDRVWRMPLFNVYKRTVTMSEAFDLMNHNNFPNYVDSCCCAAFLREFVTCGEWMHIDCYGVMLSDGVSDAPYLPRGMTGRPTRTLIEFLSQLCCTGSD